MPRKPRIPKGRRPTRTTELTFDMEEELLFRWSLLGEPAWVDEEHRRETWWRYREQLMADMRPGERPWGWWLYEAKSRPLALYGRHDVRPFLEETEAGCLARLGELTAAEAALLAAGELEAWVETFRPVDPDPEEPFFVLQDDYEASQRTLEVPGDGMLHTAGRILGTLQADNERWLVTCAACGPNEAAGGPRSVERPAGTGEGAPRFAVRREGAAWLAQHWMHDHDGRRS